MSDQLAQFAHMSPSVSQRIVEALRHHQAESGPLEIVPDGAMRRGTRLYVQVRPVEHPPTMFSFMHAVASAEIELRDSGLDILLTPEYRQRYVVVAKVAGDQTPYIYESQEGKEYEDLTRLMREEPRGGRESTTIEGYPYEGPEDKESAWQAALGEHPSAKVLK